MKEQTYMNLSELRKKYLQVKKSVFFMIIYLLGIIILSVCVKNYYLSTLLLFIALLIQIFFLRPLRKGYEKAFRISNLRLTICRDLDSDIIYEKSGGKIDYKTLKASDLIPYDGEESSFRAFMGIDGSYKGFPASVADVTVREDFRLKSKGRKRSFFNCGVWIHFTLKKESAYDFRLLHELSVPTPILMKWLKDRPELRQIKSSEMGLSSDYYIYLKNDSLPAEDFFRSFRRLKEYTTGFPAVSVRGNSVDVFIRNRVLDRAVSFSKEPDEKELFLPALPEIRKIHEMLLLLQT